MGNAYDPRLGQLARYFTVAEKLSDAMTQGQQTEIVPNDPTLLDDAEMAELFGSFFMRYALEAGGPNRTRKLLKALLKQLDNAGPNRTPEIDWQPLSAILRD